MPQQYLSSYDPTLRDRLVYGLTSLLGDNKQAGRVARGLLGSSTEMAPADLVPVLGGLLGASDALRQGDIQGAALAVMPVPGARAARIAERRAAQLASRPMRRVSRPVQDIAPNPRAVIGGNNPPGPPGAAPDRTTFSLLRHHAPRGDSERVQRLQKRLAEHPETAGHIQELVRAGEDIDRKWYNTEDLRNRFIGVLGPEKGDDAWREYLWLVGATSTGSKVQPNIRNASHYFVQGREKLLKIADDLIAGKIKPEKGSGYGHKMQGAQAKNMGMIFKGLWGPEAMANLNPKPRGFAQSLLGSTRNIAVDKHFMRLMGMMSDDPAFLHGSAEISQELANELTNKYGNKIKKFIHRRDVDGKQLINFNAKKAVREGPKDLYETIKNKAAVWEDLPNDNEYKALEGMIGKMARDMDMTPAQLQAALWMGAAKKTKVDPGSLDTFTNLFNRRLAEAGKERGLSPDEVFRRFATRKEALAIPLLGLLGGGAAANSGLLNPRD